MSLGWQIEKFKNVCVVLKIFFSGMISIFSIELRVKLLLENRVSLTWKRNTKEIIIFKIEAEFESWLEVHEVVTNKSWVVTRATRMGKIIYSGMMQVALQGTFSVRMVRML